MPTFRITSPDGTVYNVTGPEGATEQEALAQVQKQHSIAPTKTQSEGGDFKNALKRGLEASPMGLAASTLIPGYEPVTGQGALLKQIQGLPEKLSGRAGEKTAEVTGSPLAGAAVKTGLMATTMLIPGGPAKIAKSPAVEEAVLKAQDYVTRHTSLDWNSLAEGVKKTLTDIAKDSKSLDNLDPKAVERVARAKSQGIPITRGQATRDLAQITKEENIRRTAAGEPVRKTLAQQDTALHERLQGIGKEVAPESKIKASEDVGAPLQSAARRKLQVMKAQSGRAYREADKAGEMRGPADTEPLRQWLKDSLNRENSPGLERILNEYKKPDGSITIKQLEDIRQDLNAARKTPTKEAHYAGEAIKVIDSILDKSGGNLYKQARASYKLWKDEFTRQVSVRDLVSEKTNVYDRKVALENTLDHIVRGSNEQLQDIRRTLLEGGTAATRARGEKAWKDVQAGVIKYLREKAAGKRQITGTEGQLQFNSSFLDAVADLEKGGKLETLFGKTAAQKIRDLAETTRDVRTTPADRIAGPNTASRLMAIAETFLHLPGVRQLAEHVKDSATARKAATNPLSDAAARSAKNQGREQTLKSLKRVTPAAAITLENRDDQ